MILLIGGSGTDELIYDDGSDNSGCILGWHEKASRVMEMF